MTVLLYNGTTRATSAEVTVAVGQVLTLNLTYDGVIPSNMNVAWVERKNSQNEFKRFSMNDGIFCVFNVDSLSIEIPVSGVYRIVRPSILSKYNLSVGVESTVGASSGDPDQSLSSVRSDKDVNGIYTTVTFTRSDSTTYKTSVLSGGTSPEYTTRTETYYEADGVTVSSTLVFTLVYTDGDLVSETLA